MLLDIEAVSEDVSVLNIDVPEVSGDNVSALETELTSALGGCRCAVLDLSLVEQMSIDALQRVLAVLTRRQEELPCEFALASPSGSVKRHLVALNIEATLPVFDYTDEAVMAVVGSCQAIVGAKG